MVSQIGWPDLVPLSIRLLAARAFIREGKPYHQFQCDTSALRSINSLLINTRLVADDSSRFAERPSDRFPDRPLQSRLWAFGENAGTYAGHIESALASTALAHFKDAASSLDCGACAGSRACPLPCQWKVETQQNDTEAVSAGWCLEPVRELFNAVKDVCANGYGRFGKGEGPTIELETLSARFRPSTLGPSLAATTRLDGDNAKKVIVSLEIFVDDFWIDDYVALPYAMIHECVVHAWCGVPPDEEAAFLSTPFHEGWMDRIALLLLLQWCALPPDSTTTDILREYGRVFTLSAQQVNTIRSRAGQPGVHPTEVYYWRAGESAFAHLTDLLSLIALGGNAWPAKKEVWDQLNAVAKEEAIEFSLRLNASRLPHSDRGEFVAAINDLFGSTRGSSLAIAARKHHAVCRFLRTWRNDHSQVEKVVRNINKYNNKRLSNIQLTNE